MTRKLFFLLLCLLSLGRLYAQNASQAWWGYWNTTQGLRHSLELSDGASQCAIRLTAKATPSLAGSLLHGLRFYIADKTVVTGLTVWASQRQFSGSADVVAKNVPLDQLKDHQHDGLPTEVLFDEPIAILPKGNAYASIYVGFTVSVATGHTLQLPTSAVIGGGQNSCIIDWKGYDSSYGALAMQVLLSNDDFATLALQPQQAGTELIAPAGTTQELPISFTCEGTQPVSSFDYTVTIGQQTQQYSVSLDTPLSELGATATVATRMQMPDQAKAYDCLIEVTRVNGQPALASAQSPCTVLSQMPLRRSVMEEYTGTWCPNCPRGDVALRLLDEQFADRFIGISVHNADPMAIADYDGSAAKRRFLDGYPSCAIDRLIPCDPYLGLNFASKTFQTNQLVDYALAQPTVADVELSARWNDALTAVDLQAATTFRYSADEAPYALAFVVTADSLVGEGDGWLQVNTFAGSTEWDEPMRQFTEAGRSVKMAYNHVAIAVAGIDNGLAGSVTAPVEADVPQLFDHRFDLSGNVLVQRKDLLHVVAMLIDARTGRVANAASTHVEGATAGLASVKGQKPAGIAGRYTLDGRRLTEAPRRGLHIVRRTDGTVKKTW